MTRFLIPILCLLASPGAAQDPCPRGDEAVTKGVTIFFDGMQVDFRRQPDGRILETEQHDGEPEVWIYISDPSGLMHSSWLQSAEGVPDDSTRESYAYDFAGGMPVPRPGTNWSGRETSVIDGVTEENLVSWSFSKVEDYRIGDCTYSAMQVLETRSGLGAAGSDAPWVNRYVYLADLGFAVYLGGEEVGVEPFLEVPLGISASTP
jgi:hypothetical protein